MAEVVSSPGRLDVSHDEAMSTVNHQDITLPLPQPFIKWLPVGQAGDCSNIYRIGAVIPVKVFPEPQLWDDHHDFLHVVRQYFQALQCVLLGLVVQDISLLVTWRLQTWVVGGEQTSWTMRLWGSLSQRLWAWLIAATMMSSTRLIRHLVMLWFLHDSNVFTRKMFHSVKCAIVM